MSVCITVYKRTRARLILVVYLVTLLALLASEVEMAIDKLKSHKSPGTDQIPAELIKAGGRTICLEIRKLIKCR